MNPYSEILQKLVSTVVNIFQQEIHSIILYGSVANGKDTPESDIDVAVIVKTYTKDMHDVMIDQIIDLELEYNKVLSVLLIHQDKYEEWEDVLPFYRNIKQEGVVLWQAA